MSKLSQTRLIDRIVTANVQSEGGGFKVRRALPSSEVRYLDPILLIDEMGPVDYAPGEAVGAPDHPHRGFETVTYMLEGEFEHRDSAGNGGRLSPGDVQWMTAGRGIVHSEMPSAKIAEQGGRVHGFQIWVNLPASKKMSAPRYQEIENHNIPVAKSSDDLALVRVIAGEALGVSACIDTHTRIVYQHWTLSPGAEISQPLAATHNGLLYVFSGSLKTGGQLNETIVKDGQMAVLGSGDVVQLSVASSAAQTCEVLLLGGEPLNEPVVQHGPFVMNTREEIQQAIDDFRAGRMGAIEQ